MPLDNCLRRALLRRAAQFLGGEPSATPLADALPGDLARAFEPTTPPEGEGDGQSRASFSCAPSPPSTSPSFTVCVHTDDPPSRRLRRTVLETPHNAQAAALGRNLADAFKSAGATGAGSAAPSIWSATVPTDVLSVDGSPGPSVSEAYVQQRESPPALCATPARQCVIVHVDKAPDSVEKVRVYVDDGSTVESVISEVEGALGLTIKRLIDSEKCTVKTSDLAYLAQTRTEVFAKLKTVAEPPADVAMPPPSTLPTKATASVPVPKAAPPPPPSLLKAAPVAPPAVDESQSASSGGPGDAFPVFMKRGPTPMGGAPVGNGDEISSPPLSAPDNATADVAPSASAAPRASTARGASLVERLKAERQRNERLRAGSAPRGRRAAGENLAANNQQPRSPSAPITRSRA